MTAEDIYKKTEKRKTISRIKKLPTDVMVPSFTSWGEDNRYLPVGVSEYPGRWGLDIAPHMREILECLHPENPARHVSIMKSVQSTATVSIAETAIGAYIRYKLGSILFLTSTKGITKIRSSSAIDVMIDNSGLAEYVKPFSNRTKRKTSDTTTYKEFSGGVKLLMSSYGSIGDLKSNTFHFIIKDEWDEAPPELKGQGDVEGIIHGRTMGVRNYKILDISTPTRMETSRIYKSFLQGDQCYYYVPCPVCGEMQVLSLKGGNKDYGLTFSTEKDKVTGKKILVPETVRYICKYCRGKFHESKKQEIMQRGEWRPTVRAQDPRHKSYHVSGLMSPEMMLPWERICQGFLNCGFGEDILAFKDFVINYLGEPWAATERNIDWTVVRDRAEDYSLGEPPQGEIQNNSYTAPLVLTAGVDVQKDRLEMHVVGFGTGMEKWSVDYQIFYGNPAVLDDECWLQLDEWAYTHTYKIAGKDCLIDFIAIDSGYDPRRDKRAKDFTGKSNTVYEFVAVRPDRFIAIMGTDDEKAMNLIKENKIEGSSLKKRYLIAVSLLKEVLMSELEHEKGPRSIHFPRYQTVQGKKKRIPDDFFRQFLSERYQETAPGKMGWVKIYTRNEVWDTMIYAMAAAIFRGLDRFTAETWRAYYEDLIRL